MNSVQKTGLLTLGLLLVVALVGFLLGPNKANPEDAIPAVAVIDIAALPGANFVPLERRQHWVYSSDFRQPSVKHPLEGGEGSSIADWRDRPQDDSVSAITASAELPLGPIRAPILGPPPSTYRVRENDNLQKIASKQLGDGKRWIEIAQLNGLKKPYVVKIGDLLKMPTGDAPIAIPQAASSSKGWTTHVVQANQTPSDISMVVYGTSRLWKIILEANKIDDPRKVREGQTLRIPPRP